MTRSGLISILLCVGCQPVEVRFAGPAAIRDRPHDPLWAEAVLLEEAPRSCATPELRDRLGPYARRFVQQPGTSQAYLWAGGVLAGDLDGDGVLDVVAPSEPYARMYQGRSDGGLTERNARMAPFDLELGSGGSLADFDADGDLDVLVLRWDRPDVLLENDGTGRFTDVTERTGLGSIAASTSSAWGDMDRDGDLDLFVGSYDDLTGEGVVGGSYLYENVGGRFEDVSDRLPPELDVAYTRVAGFHDLDGDGYPELYVVNDVGSIQRNLLLRNVGGRFTADRGAAGLDLMMSGGGLGVGDVNDDGVPDLLIPHWGDLSLMLSEPGGRWVDAADALGVRPDVASGQTVGFGAELADVDNDGDLDGLVAFGHLEVDLMDWSNPERQPDAVFLQDEDGTFVDVAPEWGLDDSGSQRGFAVVDLNRDGWLDLLKRDLSGPDVVYLSRCGRAHWLAVSLAQPATANRHAVGAVVRVFLEDRVLVRTVTAGGTGFGSGGPPEVHFGLGTADVVERIDVVWPDGYESPFYEGVGSDRRIRIVRAAP